MSPKKLSSLNPVIFNSLILGDFTFLAPPHPAAKVIFLQNHLFVLVGYLCGVCEIFGVGFHCFLNDVYTVSRKTVVFHQNVGNFTHYMSVDGKI